MRIALTRAVSPALAQCELTYKERVSIDVERARTQHAAYERLLGELGTTVLRLPPDPELADSVFVEDTALVLDDVAIITRAGAASRLAEHAAVAEALAPFRPLRTIEAPATIDGGDVMRIGRTLYVGRSQRTNAEAIAQLREHVEPLGYTVIEMAVTGCLHLKSGCTYVGRGSVIVNREWVDASCLESLELIDVPPSEPWGASVLHLGGTVVMPSGFPMTRALLERLDHRVRAVDLSEMQKAEGGPTCLSIVFESTA
jgi:dimethylargininase